VETVAFPPESDIERLIVGIASNYCRAFASVIFVNIKVRQIHVPIPFGRAPFGDELRDYRQCHLR
jgi:hypothetical protein